MTIEQRKQALMNWITTIQQEELTDTKNVLSIQVPVNFSGG